MSEVVRKQLILLALCMGAAIPSMLLGTVAEESLHVSGFAVALAALGIPLFLLLKVRPDLFR
ncbi:MAG: hypothetical protein E6J25_06195 [Chloroflexi bacterium]|nr:MAG: hypothetical protein DMD33_02875 [Gemmatimonadota bacterium]TMC43264.1 MAG: hypothetical protein E6J25_06195 [Chloroflexota bacterium]TME45967.1 MAG: hypothetical protein E6I60_15455 [Chloroflexota bacterium]